MSAHVLIAGPPSARPFLDQLGAAVGAEGGATIVNRYDLATPSDYAAWAETDIFATFGLPCSPADIAAAPRLRAVVTPSLGYEGVDTAALAARGIGFANGHAAENFETVAEAAILFMLTNLYRLREVEARLRDDVRREGPPTARMLKGKTVGIIGFGNIARALVARLSGWDTDILVATRSPLAARGPNIRPGSLDELLARSDILVPLLPLTPETHGMLSRERLLRTKAGAMLINLSRGAIVDEAALTDPEVTAHLGPVALDVFTVEPLPADSPLRALEGALLTNHEVSHTQENLGALFDLALANLRAAVRGEAMPTQLG